MTQGEQSEPVPIDADAVPKSAWADLPPFDLESVSKSRLASLPPIDPDLVRSGRSWLERASPALAAVLDDETVRASLLKPLPKYEPPEHAELLRSRVKPLVVRQAPSVQQAMLAAIGKLHDEAKAMNETTRRQGAASQHIARVALALSVAGVLIGAGGAFGRVAVVGGLVVALLSVCCLVATPRALRRAWRCCRCRCKRSVFPHTPSS